MGRARMAAQARRGAGRLEAKTAEQIAAGAGRVHRPVMLDECVELVTGGIDGTHADGAVIVDCTLGLAGHAIAFLKAAPAARLIGIDRDAEALALATRRMADEGLADRFTPVHAAFDDFAGVLDAQGVDRIDAAFMDLGLSSLQIDETARGFSYSHDGPLDMRMDAAQELTAARVLAEYDEADLSRIFKDYGEERFARQIARAVVRRRDEGGEPLETSSQLVDLVSATIPASRRAAGNPAKRVFQALRIEVNGELDKLAATLPAIALRLRVGGRIVVESYHSLEDRTTKAFMAQGLAIDAPADMPVVPPEAMPFFTPLTRGALKARPEEIEVNPRSASVRLRAVELSRELPERALRRFGRPPAPDERAGGGHAGQPNRHGKRTQTQSKSRAGHSNHTNHTNTKRTQPTDDRGERRA